MGIVVVVVSNLSFTLSLSLKNELKLFFYEDLSALVIWVNKYYSFAFLLFIN